MRKYTENEIKKIFEAGIEGFVNVNTLGEYTDPAVNMSFYNFQKGFNTAVEIASKVGIGYTALRHSERSPNRWFIVPNKLVDDKSTSYIDDVDFEYKIPGFHEVNHHLFHHLSSEGDGEKELIALGFKIGNGSNLYRYP